MLSLGTHTAPRLRQFCCLSSQLSRFSHGCDFTYHIHGWWYQRSLCVAELICIHRLQLATQNPHRCQVTAPSQPPDPFINRFLCVPHPHLSHPMAPHYRLEDRPLSHIRVRRTRLPPTNPIPQPRSAH